VVGIEAQRLDVDAGRDGVLEERDVVDVDGQQVVLGLRDERQRGAAAGGLGPGEATGVMRCVSSSYVVLY
jgi:hypothetical protein